MGRPFLARFLTDTPGPVRVSSGSYDEARQLTLDADGHPKVLARGAATTRTYREQPDPEQPDRPKLEAGSMFSAGLETFTKARPDPTDPAESAIVVEANLAGSWSQDSSSGIIAY